MRCESARLCLRTCSPGQSYLASASSAFHSSAACLHSCLSRLIQCVVSLRCSGTAASAETPGEMSPLCTSRDGGCAPCSGGCQAVARRLPHLQPCVVAGMQRQSLFSHGCSQTGSTDPSLCPGGRGRAWLRPTANKWELSATACQAGAIWSMCRAWC